MCPHINVTGFKFDFGNTEFKLELRMVMSFIVTLLLISVRVVTLFSISDVMGSAAAFSGFW